MMHRAIVRHENLNYLGISYTVIRLLTTGYVLRNASLGDFVVRTS
jgi:hypothetical protein